MKRIAAIIMIICMAVTGTCTGIPEKIVTGDDMTAAAASCPALKKINYKATGNQRKDIVGFAKTQIGYKEGSNNNTYFGKWFGCNYNPWCAMFVVWSARKAGVTKSVIPSLATADRSWAKKQKVYHKSKQWGGSYTPKAGDLIYFSWSVRDWADHIGMVSGTGKSGGTTYVYTIEGNKHDKVVEGSYPINNKYILGYASPKYGTGTASEEEETTTEPGEDEYNLKYRDGLDETGNDEEDAIIPPATGHFGTDLVLSETKFTRKGYKYSQWKVYKENSSGKLVYLCRDADQTTEKWYQKGSIASGYSQVYVDCGGTLNIGTKVSGTIYVSPVWKKKTYKITYDANGGTGAPEVQKKTYGKDLKLTKDKPTRSGYEFKGWATSASASKVEYKSGATYTKNKAMTLYAVWKKGTYEVKTTADVNVRSGPGSDHKKVSTISSGKKVKIKKEKNGWGQMTDNNWIPLKYTMRLNVTEYKLIYNDGVSSTKNDSDVISPKTASYGSAVTTSSGKFTRKGHHYEKWQVYYLRNGEKNYLYSNQDSGKQKWYRKGKAPDNSKKVKVKTGSDLTIDKSVGEKVYLTPDWDTDTYEITYKANGGKKAPDAQTKTFGKTLTLSKKKPVRSGGYKFLGWSRDKDASKAKYEAGDKFKSNKSTKLYAVWKTTWFKVKTKEKVNKREGPGKDYSVTGTIAKGKTVKIVKKKNGWGKLKSGAWISLDLTKKLKDSSSDKNSSNKKGSSAEDEDTSDSDPETDETADADADADDHFSVKVTEEDGINSRYGPSKQFDVASSYAYDDVLKISEVKDGWGRLADEESEQWILLKNTKITEGYQVKITAEELNQRKGPGSDYDSEGYIDPGTYSIVQIDGDWGKIESTGNWVKLEYTKRVTEKPAEAEEAEDENSTTE